MMNKSLAPLIMIAVVFTIFIIPASTISHSHDIEATTKNTDSQIITVALYDTWGVNNYYIREILEYGWTANNCTYQFDLTTIDADAVSGIRTRNDMTLTTDNYNVFIIGASAYSYLVDGQDATWANNVRQFVANGGGYLGICGGANAASQGFENPQNGFHRRVNSGVLGLADVYINDNFLGEWQYLMKFGFWGYDFEYPIGTTPSYISVNTTVVKNAENIIFSEQKDTYRYITYAGGPGMYPANKEDDKLGPIIPLLTYNEEPMITKPLHYWIPTAAGWRIYKNVTTNLFGTYAGIAATYNDSGRVVLYGPHPEDRVIVNGTVQEYRGIGMLNFFLPFKTYVFNYFGTPLEKSYNWGVVRRSIAWAANIPESDLPALQE